MVNVNGIIIILIGLIVYNLDKLNSEINNRMDKCQVELKKT